MLNFGKQLLYEDGKPSLTRVISVISFFAFLVGSFYLLIMGKVWQHYPEFSTMTAGGGVLGQVFNKFINSKYNTQEGSFNPVNKEVNK